MARHYELAPDGESVALLVAQKALDTARNAGAKLSGTIATRNADGSLSLSGPDAGVVGSAQWVGDTTVPGVPTGVEVSSRRGVLIVRWDGTLDGGVPDDFSNITVYASWDGLVEPVTVGSLSAAGELTGAVAPVGTVVSVYAVAFDLACDEYGCPNPNISERTVPVVVTIEPLVSQDELDSKADQILASADAAAAEQIKQVNKDLEAAQQQIDANTAGVAAGTQLAQEAKDKADANAQSIEAESAELDEYKQAVDEAMADLDRTVADHGSVLDAVQSDVSQAKLDILTNATASASAQSTASAAQTTADSKNRVFAQLGDPRNDPKVAAKLKPGDMWWETMVYTEWAGEPNNSESYLYVCDDEIRHMWIWNGSEWASHTLYAQDVLVNGSVVTDLLAANSVSTEKLQAGSVQADTIAATALYGKVVKGGEFRTSNDRLVINNTGFNLYNTSGSATITMNAANGSATFNDVNIVNGGITTPAITGGTITGADFTLTDNAGRQIGKLNSSGFVFGDSLSYAKVNGEWKLSINGAVQSAGEISGTTITGATVQTTDGRMKFVDGGLVATDRDGNTSVLLDTETGYLYTNGAIFANGVLEGAHIHGGLVSSSTSLNILDEDEVTVLTSFRRNGITVPGDNPNNWAKLDINPGFVSLTSKYADVNEDNVTVVSDTRLDMGRNGIAMNTLRNTFEMGDGGISLTTAAGTVVSGAGGISITAGDGSKIRIGSNGASIQTRDGSNMTLGTSAVELKHKNGFGLSISTSGWSLNWPGNHKIATGPKAGALYIDGKEILTV